MNIFRRKGLKRIKIKGNRFVIKKLTPFDFIESEEIMPFTMFREESEYMRNFSKIKTDKELEAEYDKSLELMKKICISGVLVMDAPIALLDTPGLLTDKYKVISLFFEPDTIEIGVRLYKKILNHSLSLFVRLYSIKRDTLIYYGEMSQKFSKTPIECLSPKGDYTDCDAYLFNSFVLNVMIKEQNKAVKAQKRSK